MMRNKRLTRGLRRALILAAGVAFSGWGGPARGQQNRPTITGARVAERVRGFDANSDGRITRAEFQGPPRIFERLDANHDGVIDAAELETLANDQKPFRAGGPLEGGGGGKRRPAQTQAPGRTPVGGIPASVKPLSEMSAADRYKGEDGGLYGQGRNAPPPEHLAAALKAARSIEPLDQDGKPAKDGKIVFISFGMSNTTMEFGAFQRLLHAVQLPPALMVVDGAQGGKEARAWANSAPAAEREGTPWAVLASRLKAAGAAPQQVQVVWLKQAVARPQADGDFPAHAQKFHDYLVTDLQKLKSLYPNLQIVYMSNRIYAGYAVSELNPEPYAYEYAYALRGLIRDQIAGKPELNCDPAKGAVKAPLLLWGPDLWANGMQARKDGLTWSRDELGPDGTHPADAGREKVARLLLQFLQSDPTAKAWFTGK